ncbi:MAG: hydantoinase [Rhodospirillaceae bacterium]|nr:hydantoinase [Rhodospirillaceae bacterium]
MRVGIEVGGTFTDLVVVDGAEVRTAKVPSTPSRPDEGAMNAIEVAGLDPSEIDELVHGSTVATNAVLERKGAKVCFFVTRGIRDILLIQRHDRRAIYDLHYRKPQPVVPRYNTYEIIERLSPDGQVVVALDRTLAKALATKVLKSDEFDAVAICFLHAYMNPTHEHLMAEIIADVSPNLPITCSSDVTREFREYERASTTTLAAYVQPVVVGYVRRFSKALEKRGFRGQFSIMQSNGGRMPAEAMAKNAISALFSGPAAGVVGAVRRLAGSGYSNLITLDMGGTSTDVALISEGETKLAPMTMIDGLPVKTPVVDIVTVGAGGGSIAWMDDGGLLRVGPQSAGASPGPACYGRGGDVPTVTDAHLIRGTLRVNSFLGGEMKVDKKLASNALQTIAESFASTLAEMADDVIRLAEANIVRAIQQVSTERGSDPRDFVLVPFGGAGPLHAARVAEDLEIAKVVIPPNAGVLSAAGLLLSDHIHYRSLTNRLTLIEENVSEILKTIEHLICEARDYLFSLGINSVEKFDIILEMRYVGQAFEIPVKLSAEGLDDISVNGLEQLFSIAHHRMFEFSKPHGDPIEIISFRVGAKSSPSKMPMGDLSTLSRDNSESIKVKITERGKKLEAAVLHRKALNEQLLDGPCLVQDEDSTIYVPPLWRVKRDFTNNVILIRNS